MTRAAPKRENMLINLVCNVVLPILILTKLSGEDRLGPTLSLIIAISLPVGYGIYDYVQRRKFNMLSALGLANVLVTGLIGLAELDGIWIAVKEASFPGLIGICILLSMRTKYPLAKTFLYNDQVFDVEKVEKELIAKGHQRAFAKLLDKATYILVASFCVSAVLSFILAKMIVTSPGGTIEFNQQVGKMNALTWVVVIIPAMVLTGIALWRLISGIKRLTGLGLEEVMQAPAEKS